MIPEPVRLASWLPERLSWYQTSFLANPDVLAWQAGNYIASVTGKAPTRESLDVRLEAGERTQRRKIRDAGKDIK